MKIKKSTLIKLGSVVGIVVLGFLIMTLLGSVEKESNKREVDPEVRLVKTETVLFGDLVLEIEGNGVIESQKTLQVVCQAPGEVMYAKNDLKDGTFVKNGELILEIDSREVENRLYTLRSEFINSVALVLPEIKIENEKAYRKWYEYFNRLDIHQPMPELPEISSSQEKTKLSTRGIYSKYYAVNNQEILLSKHKIISPFTGYIKSNGIIKGSYVSTGQPLFTLSDALNVEIAVPLLLDEVNLIDFTNPPTVKIFTEKNKQDVLQGKIYRRETLLNRNSQTLNVYVSFYNGKLKPSFLPGNYVSVKVDGMKMKNVAKIPRYVVDNENQVYTMEEGKLARTEVEVVAIQGDVAIIKNTMPDEMKIITTILQKPLIGMDIQSTNESIELKEEAPVTEKENQLSHTE